jgi:hypothetical protein
MTCTINVSNFFKIIIIFLSYFNTFKADPILKEHKLNNGLVMGRKIHIFSFF